jgi:PAS domain S-box-containing protein
VASQDECAGDTATPAAEQVGVILVVDDSKTSRTWAKLQLRQVGYTVREAESGGEALAMVVAAPPDVVLLDVVLPDMDGYEVTRQLRASPLLADIPIILVTTLGDAASKVRGLEAGANDFVTKPPDEAELRTRVRNLLRLKRSREDLLAEKSRTELLYHVGRELSAELDLDTLLSRILELTIGAVGVSRGSVILLDEQGRAFRNIFSHQGEITMVSDTVREKIVVEGLAGWVIRNRQSAIIADTSRDPRWVAVEATHVVTRSVIAVPLGQPERVSGVLTLTDEQPDAFSQADLGLLTSIASQASVAIDKARAYLREQVWARKLQFVSGVAHQVTSLLDPTRILEDVAWLIQQTFDYYYVELAMREGEEVVFSGWNCQRGKGPLRTSARLPLDDENIVAWVARHGNALLVPDVYQDARYRPSPELPDVVAELTVPLEAGGEILGVLDVQGDSHGGLAEEDIPLLSILASHIAVALVNAQLFKTVEQERGRLAAILTGTADAIVATDADLRITLLNPAAERAFGVSFDQARGRPLGEALPYEELTQAFVRSREVDGPSGPSELPLPDGRTLFCTVSPVAAGPKGAGGWVSVLQDITTLKELDRMKSEFVSTVSHDLRSPLSVIRGYAEMLSHQTAGDVQEYAARIKTSSEQMSELITDLLDLGKIEAGVGEVRGSCQMEELVRAAVDTASFQAELRQIGLTSTVPDTLPPVLGDRGLLRQVLSNLISNALKYTLAGGSVAVRAWEDKGRVCVDVRDTGVGVPRQALPRLFEKFYRVPRPETEHIPGTGLGLAIVKAIVEGHGGQLWVESEVGEGSTFGFCLPQYEEAPSQGESDKTSA